MRTASVRCKGGRGERKPGEANRAEHEIDNEESTGIEGWVRSGEALRLGLGRREWWRRRKFSKSTD